jgi:acyl-CoA thioester hydrolase
MPGTVTTKRIEVRSTDIDGDGIVNNAIFYQYCEQSRLEHLRTLGVNAPPKGDRPYARRFTIVETRCRYLAPAAFRDVLAVETRTTNVGRSSFTLAYRVLRDEDGALLAEGESVQVWLGEDGRSTPLPDAIRAALEGSLTPVE